MQQSRFAQRGCGCPIPGGGLEQVVWSPGQPGLVPDLEVGGPACGRSWNLILGVPSNPSHSVIVCICLQRLDWEAVVFSMSGADMDWILIHSRRCAISRMLREHAGFYCPSVLSSWVATCIHVGWNTRSDPGKITVIAKIVRTRNPAHASGKVWLARAKVRPEESVTLSTKQEKSGVQTLEVTEE